MNVLRTFILFLGLLIGVGMPLVLVALIFRDSSSQTSPTRSET